MSKGYIVERSARLSPKSGTVFRSAHSGQFVDVRVMSKNTFDRASARANTIIKDATRGLTGKD